MISVNMKGSWKKVNSFFEVLKESYHISNLDVYGQRGVDLLSYATPVDTGKTALSWGYEIERGDGELVIRWINSNVNNYVNIALIIQYGHMSKNGSWIEGRDYINPAIQPLFDEIAEEVWKEVKNA